MYVLQYSTVTSQTTSAAYQNQAVNSQFWMDHQSQHIFYIISKQFSSQENTEFINNIIDKQKEK